MSDETDNPEDALDFELEPLTPEEASRGARDEEDEDPTDAVDPSLAHQVEGLREHVENLEQLVRVPPTLKNPFVAGVTGSTFQEMCVLNGTVTNFLGGRSGTATLLGAGQGVLVEVVDPPAMRFVLISGGGGGAGGNIQEVYLTQVGGSDGTGLTEASWTYDVYSDVAKTDLLASAKPQTARRVCAASNTPAEVGLAVFADDGTFDHLLYAFESYPLDSCGLSVGTF